MDTMIVVKENTWNLEMTAGRHNVLRQLPWQPIFVISIRPPLFALHV